MANNDYIVSNANKYTKQIEKELYDTPSSIDNSDDIKKLVDLLNDNNENYKKISGMNIIEFLTSLELNNSNSSRNLSLQSKDKIESLEETLKNAMQGSYFFEEKQRFLRYEDYRLIDAYIPELSKCIDLYRDCILSPDDITKRSLNYYYKGNLVSRENDNNDVVKNLLFLDEEYNLSREVKENIRESLLLGDLFTIILNINDAMGRVLKEDDIFFNESQSEDDSEDYGNVINESMMDFDDNVIKELLYTESSILDKKKKKDEEKEIEQVKKDIIKSINDNVKFYRDPCNLISKSKQYLNEDQDKDKTINVKNLKLTGSIVTVPNPEDIIKLEIDKQCVGYIYIERFHASTYNENALTTSTLNRPFQNKTNDVFNSRYDFLKNGTTNEKDKTEIITDIFIKGISKKIDCNFINKNAEFKRLIYSLLKEDYILEKQLEITFLQPEDVFHFKLDSNDTYGISKLSKCLFLAKIYLATLITNMMQKISRGRDKRAFYIDTGIDDDIEGVVQSFIKDIKSKEITADHLGSITTLLQSTGAFEDYFIPTVDGERPIEIDTVSGMDIEVDNDFLNNLLKSAISGTGIPANYIDATQDVDFARTLAMQNQSFVRTLVNYQNDYGEYYTKIVQRLYYNEFKTKENNIDLIVNDIKVIFPPPIYLSLTNTNDQISSAGSVMDFLTQLFIPDNPDDTKIDSKRIHYKKKLAEKYFLPTMEWELFKNLYEESMDDLKKEEIIANGTVIEEEPEEEDTTGSDDMSGF